MERISSSVCCGEKGRVCSALAALYKLPPGEGNLSLACQRVPENHAGCGLDGGKDQRRRSFGSAKREREASLCAPDQSGTTATLSNQRLADRNHDESRKPLAGV